MSPPPAPESFALPPGTRLGEFELREVMGVGGFGIVYRAHDSSLEREVAIKEYMPSALAQRTEGTLIAVRQDSGREHFETGRRSFINEAKLLARFDHTSLLKVYRFWEANGTAYMAMPLLQGQPLKVVQRSWSQPPDETQLLNWLRPLLEALALLHWEGVYHRDISPDNISIEPGGRPVLMDFGAARRVLQDITETMTVILKPSYAPIEQYANADSGPLRQGPWTDLYALGATVHFLLKGAPPPAATTRAVKDPMQPLASQPLPGCSPEFLSCIDWMLAPNPADRPKNVAKLWQRLFGDAPLHVHGDVVTTDRPEAVPPPAFGAASVGPAPASLSLPANGDPFADPPSLSVPAPAKATPPAPPAAAAGPPVGAAVGFLGRLGSLFRRNVDTPPAPSAPTVTALHAELDGRTLLLPASAHGQPGVPPQTTPPPDTTVILRAAGTSPGKAPRGLALMVLRCDVSSFIGQVHTLQPGETIIGRSAPGLSIADPGLSTRHARIELGSAGAELTDLDSTNGTWVNGVRAAAGRPVRLTLGANIQMGTTLLSFSRPGLLPLPDLAGQLIDGRYRLQACLHTSPKGVLYSAQKQPSGVEVVVKILSPDYAADASYRSRFADEAGIAARLQHPHICRLDDHGETSITVGVEAHRVPFAAYPVLSGGNLAQRASQFSSLPLETIERWVQAAAAALAHAHGAGMVHGNLKPSALCFDGAANLYITDFAGSGAGADGAAVFGTPGFTAPEQWRGEPLQPASDQYALAAIAYYMLTGSRPHEALADPAVREQALAVPPPAAHLEAQKRYGRTLSPAVTAVLNQALAGDPGTRFPDIERFARDLAQALRRGRSAQARHVFISYRRDDSAILATYIAERLEQRHEITSFVDVQGLDGAARFPARIERAIADCEVFVCILGSQTLQSPHVRRELALAAEQGKPMIPVFQESYRMPDESEVDAAIGDLLQYDGIQLLDKRNIYVQAAVDELALQVRKTLARNAR